MTFVPSPGGTPCPLCRWPQHQQDSSLLARASRGPALGTHAPLLLKNLQWLPSAVCKSSADSRAWHGQALGRRPASPATSPSLACVGWCPPVPSSLNREPAVGTSGWVSGLGVTFVPHATNTRVWRPRPPASRGTRASPSPRPSACDKWPSRALRLAETPAEGEEKCKPSNFRDVPPPPGLPSVPEPCQPGPGDSGTCHPALRHFACVPFPTAGPPREDTGGLPTPGILSPR